MRYPDRVRYPTVGGTRRSVVPDGRWYPTVLVNGELTAVHASRRNSTLFSVGVAETVEKSPKNRQTRGRLTPYRRPSYGVGLFASPTLRHQPALQDRTLCPSGQVLFAVIVCHNGRGEGKRRSASMEGMCRHDHSAEYFGRAYVTNRARSPEVAIRFSKSGAHCAA